MPQRTDFARPARSLQPGGSADTGRAVARSASKAVETLRVLHSCRDWLPLTETWLFDEIRYLPEDVSSQVVCERLRNRAVFQAVPVTQLGGPALLAQKALRGLGLLGHLPAYGRVARDTQARILHSHFGDAAWRDSKLAAALDLLHVVTFYGLDVNLLPTQDPAWIERYGEVFGSAAAVLCEGPHMARRVTGLGCPPQKVHVHHLGVEVRGIPFSPRTLDAGAPLRVLVAASFLEKKGIPDAIRAVSRAARQVPIELTIAGDAIRSARSQAEKGRIEAALAGSGLGSRVRLLGLLPRGRLREEARSHHIFLAPSVTASDGDTEGGAPVTILEMMASGMPVVATTHCDIPELLGADLAGLLAPEHDIDALARSLLLLARAPERWPELGCAARARVEADFDVVTQGYRLGALYRDLLEGPR